MKEQEISESFVDNDVLESQKINKKFALVSVSVFLCLIILPTIVWGTITLLAPDVAASLDFDTGENRAKAEMPEEIDLSTLTTDLEAYYNDRVPFRAILYTFQNDIFRALEKPYTNHILPFLTNLFYSDYEGEQSHLEEESQVDVDNLFGNEETETLPDMVVGNQGDANCAHTLKSTTVKEATCSEFGEVEKKCSKCGYSELHYTEKAEHTEVLLSKTPSTCLVAGKELYTCSVCGEDIVKALEKLNHTGTLIRTQAANFEDYGYSLYSCRVCGTEYRQNITPRVIDNSYLAPQIKGPTERGTIIGRHNWLFFTGSNSLSYYQGTNVMTPAEMNEWVVVMNELQAVCDKKGIQLAFMSMPNREIVYAEHMPTYSTVITPRRSEVLKDYIDENTDLTYVYPLEEMKAFKPYFRVCFKYDTHWNPAGAFIGTQTLYRDLGLPNMSIMDVPVTSSTKKGGDLVNIGELDKNHYSDDTTYNIQYRTENTQQTVYQTSDGNLVISQCANANNKKNLVFFGDSFRIAMTPFLQKDFTRCTIAHRELLSQNKGNPVSSYDANLVREVKNANILVVSAVERFDYSMLTQAKELIRILNSN